MIAVGARPFVLRLPSLGGRLTIALHQHSELAPRGLRSGGAHSWRALERRAAAAAALAFGFESF